MVARRIAVIIDGISVGAPLNRIFDNIHIALLCRIKKRGLPLRIAGIDMGAGLNQRFHHIQAFGIFARQPPAPSSGTPDSFFSLADTPCFQQQLHIIGTPQVGAVDDLAVGVSAAMAADGI